MRRFLVRSAALAISLVPHALTGSALVGPALVAPPPAGAVELQGQTWFASPPWQVIFTSFYSDVNQVGGEYYFTVTLPAAAGVGLGGLTITQTRGVDRSFNFDLAGSRAFLGRPRHEGAAVPVQVRFDDTQRRFQISFPEPPQPGATVTLALKPWMNPNQSDTYMFAVQALPAGPNPVPAPLGFATMQIYSYFRF
ncbi:MAG: DUF2808 domain-containing protein [Cyanobacteria bacterium]|nr:DUF2808 domain-containing protein [Cyanobacteriota bacterium]